MNYLDSVVLLLLVAVISVAVCRRFQIPTMLGYLIAGFIAGPGALGILSETPATEFVGEIGIVFLMFSIGLEFSLSKLKAMKDLVLGLGSMQVVFTILFFMAVLMNTGASWEYAFTLGAAFAMSSTAIVSKILGERSEINLKFGQMTMGVLLMQDIMAVPIMILIQSIGGGGEELMSLLLFAMLKMAAVLVVLLFLGEKLMRPWFRFIARQEIRELFMLNVLLVILGVAYLTSLAGLSLALGAFVAGILIAETQYRFQVEDDIKPFKDILLGFFFITVGMKLDLMLLAENYIIIIIFVAALIVMKAFIVFLVAARRHDKKDSFMAATYLGQGGEFGFVILSMGIQANLLDSQYAQIGTASILISMLVSPFVMKLAPKMKNAIFKTTWDEKSVDLHSMLVENMNKNEHVLIIGYGRAGQIVARLLQQQKITYYALDLSTDRVQAARLSGEPVAYGDAKRRDILMASGLKRAKLVVITMHSVKESEHIVDLVMKLRPTLPVIVRSVLDESIEPLMNLGAEEVVTDNREIGLGLATETMLYYGLPFRQVYDAIRQVRSNKYTSLNGLFLSSNEIVESQDAGLLYRDSLLVYPDSFICGKKIKDIPFKSLKVGLLGIRRNLHQIAEPDDELVIEPNDVIMVLGVPDSVRAVEAFMSEGPGI